MILKVTMPNDLAIQTMERLLEQANQSDTDVGTVIAISMALDALKREAAYERAVLQNNHNSTACASKSLAVESQTFA